jgi:cysteine desulfurase/selenocysteine lyase
MTTTELESERHRIRQQFPMLQVADSTKDAGEPTPVYFDNAATALKPQTVLDAVHEYDATISANIHRGVHRLGERATELFEGSRSAVQNFLGARDSSEIILTSGTTMGINLVALGWARRHLRAGDEILLTAMEHHANLVPWHLLARDVGVLLKHIPLRQDPSGVTLPELDIEALPKLVSSRTRLASFVMVSNAVGTINPVTHLIRAIHELNPSTHVLLDAAQAAAHQPIDVQSLGCSALAFSGHKIMGPTGTGALYLRQDFRDEFEPCIGGGDMIREVTLQGSTFADFPAKLEPGTPNISGVLGMGAAIGFLKSIGFETITRLEEDLAHHLQQSLAEIAGVKVVGQTTKRIPLASMVLDGAHPHDVATLLDRYGVAVRAGHHCAQPLMKALGILGTSRASLSFYNTPDEIRLFTTALRKTLELLS